MLRRLLLKLQIRSLERQRKNFWLEFAGSDVQNIDETLREYDTRIAELQSRLEAS